MYRLVEDDYTGLFSRVARQTCLNVAATYPANAYWTNRKQVGADMQSNLTV